MPDQYSGTIRSSADPRPIAGARCPSTGFHLFRKKSMPCDTVANWHRPRIHQLHERSQFSSPRQLPVRPLAASLIATSAPLMIINLQFADRHIPVFHATELPLPRPHPPMLLERSAGPSSRIPVTAWTGSITIFS